MVEVGDEEVAALVATGLLAPECLGDRVAIKDAIEIALSDVVYQSRLGLAGVGEKRA